MSGILDKYGEWIKLTYNYTYRNANAFKNIRENYKMLKDVYDITLEVYRDSIIKKYETLEDLTWKLLSKIFKEDGLDINNPRGCYKQAFKEGLIEDMNVEYQIPYISCNKDITEKEKYKGNTIKLRKF